MEPRLRRHLHRRAGTTGRHVSPVARTARAERARVAPGHEGRGVDPTHGPERQRPGSARVLASCRAESPIRSGPNGPIRYRRRRAHCCCTHKTGVRRGASQEERIKWRGSTRDSGACSTGAAPDERLRRHAHERRASEVPRETHGLVQHVDPSDVSVHRTHDPRHAPSAAGRFRVRARVPLWHPKLGADALGQRGRWARKSSIALSIRR